MQLIGGAPYIKTLDDIGDPVFTPMTRRKVIERQNRNRTYPYYAEYAVPDEHGGGLVTFRLQTNDADRARGFNRAEHLRAIPQNDPDYEYLYADAQTSRA